MNFLTLDEIENVEKRIEEWAEKGLEIDIEDAIKYEHFKMNNFKNEHDKSCKCNNFQTQLCMYHVPSIIIQIPDAPPAPALKVEK